MKTKAFCFRLCVFVCISSQVDLSHSQSCCLSPSTIVPERGFKGAEWFDPLQQQTFFEN